MDGVAGNYLLGYIEKVNCSEAATDLKRECRRGATGHAGSEPRREGCTLTQVEGPDGVIHHREGRTSIQGQSGTLNKGCRLANRDAAGARIGRKGRATGHGNHSVGQRRSGTQSWTQDSQRAAVDVGRPSVAVRSGERQSARSGLCQRNGRAVEAR